MKKDREEVPGYMTLEVAFLFPVIFTIIMLCIFLSFFVYDRCLLENSAYIAALRGSRMQLMDNQEIYKETSKLAEELIAGRVFGVNGVTQTVTVSAGKVEVSYEARVIPPVGTLLLRLTQQDYFRICVTKKADRIMTIPLIRGFRKIERMVKSDGSAFRQTDK